ncbi:MAG: hypothetical protein KH452_12135 [Clostridiales bacterium]|nr:hypothetical protein [Clostridiales bacterium]
MMPYILTFIGMFLRQWYINIITPEGGAVTFLTVVAVILTALGLWKTYRCQGGRYADRKSLGIAFGIHGVIWLAGLLFFGAVSWILDKIIYLIALIIGLVIAYTWFHSLSGGSSRAGSGSDGMQGETDDLNALPNIMYDGYQRWQLQARNNDHVVYHNDEGGTIIIRQASITGGSIQTDVGFFQTYR